jgi:excinuclease ABC subunit A
VLQQLVEAGNTVVVVEHNLDMIKAADWVIDLGPEGGAAGGQIVAEGTPEQVAQVEASITGAFLRPLLSAEAPPSEMMESQSFALDSSAITYELTAIVFPSVPGL